MDVYLFYLFSSNTHVPTPWERIEDDGYPSWLLDTPTSVKRIAEEAVQKELAKRRKNEPPERILLFVSKSHAFSENKVKGRITFGHDFFFDLVDAVHTSAFESAAPDKTFDENKVHHPYFLDETKLLIKSAVEKGVNISQQLLWTKSGRWLTLDDKKKYLWCRT